MAIWVWPVDAVTGAPQYTGRGLREPMSIFSTGATTAKPFGVRSGVRPGTSITTVTATSTTWTIGAHAGILDLEPAVEASGYAYAINAVSGLPTGAVTAANATNPRVDIVWLRLDDPAESDGSSVPAVVAGYTAGTAAPSPVPPATPARCMVLANINVPVSGGGSPTVTWKAPTAVSAGAAIPVSSQAERDALVAYAGLEVKRLDLAGCPTEKYSGSAWAVSSVRVVQRDNTGATPAAGTAPLIQAFVASGTTSGGLLTVTFPQAFTVIPIVTAMTASGAIVAPLINAGQVTTTTVNLVWVGAGAAAVTVHVIAIGW